MAFTPESQGSLPNISVMIPTCNRPDDVRRCLECLAKVSYPSWEIVLVDQSDDDRTEAVVSQLTSGLPQLTYHHMHPKGLTRARNLGLAVASGELMAFLDDDCTVEPDWLEQVAGAFARHPQAALIFGMVKDAIGDKRYMVSVHDVKVECALRGRLSFPRANGMGASMYLRRAACSSIGPYDVHLGPGACLFSSVEESDYAYRVLASGRSIVETPSIVVWHYGARDYGDGTVWRLIRSHAYADGAQHMKVLRSGDIAALPLIALRILRYVSFFILPYPVLRRRRDRLVWLVMFVRGLFGSFRLGVDRQYCLFVAR